MANCKVGRKNGGKDKQGWMFSAQHMQLVSLAENTKNRMKYPLPN
jgi:hypothetical protein